MEFVECISLTLSMLIVQGFLFVRNFIESKQITEHFIALGRYNLLFSNC